ncbi:MAG: aspartate carbamoyltransferase catalytic subunit [Rhodobacteraceae bacterium]|nr:aspartate carbamoyltransferase catalytic subunit [Paracoccaceae bacterium]
MTRLVGMGRQPTPTETKIAGGWQPYLDDGEKVIWQGAPDAGLHFHARGIMQSLFGVVFFGFSIFWVTMALKGSGPDGGLGAVFPLFGVPFVLVGFYLVIGHWFFDSYKRSRTRYALTDKRALIAVRVFGKRMKSYPITRSKPITVKEGHMDSVIFDSVEKRGKNGSYTVDIGFQYIPDAMDVYKMMRDIQSKLGRL